MSGNILDRTEHLLMAFKERKKELQELMVDLASFNMTLRDGKVEALIKQIDEALQS